ncbi:MAG: ethanolamine utilization protein EutJ [Acetobacterium sp.]|jgi:ethanolamine utilization protein EutJ|uniref:ethanolamine utilization protein EutJ n=1 Tax=Acetobacterium TaxID=33951 RepID=UPI000DBEB7FA|nr:ethanolamine utilization protein EutJ [Acetobacterium sp. KB-1]AWW25856.1 ethanolamine utilization protein EutJ [Acetobacterium sp. KB-1]MDK2941142.1 ethanolamine utilization protein EutJ [Acetobacterium sp.]
MDLFKESDKITFDFINILSHSITPKNKERLMVGVDLGTAYIVICVLDENKNPIAGAYRFAQVVKDGLLVDYMGALKIVKQLKIEIEDKIGCELKDAAVAIPPGTTINDTKYIKNVVEGAGFDVINVVDEPTAANAVLGIKNGVVVDIGGGTTGLAIIEEGKIVAVADEATGGTQCTLVIAGAYKISFDEAEIVKQDPDKQEEISGLLRPVAQKIASIIKKHINEYSIDGIYLVGGTSCLLNIEKVIEKDLNIKTYKPKNPHFVTPIGIAMNCVPAKGCKKYGY